MYNGCMKIQNKLRKGTPMNNYIITTDNTNDFPNEYYDEHGLGCAYLTYTINGTSYTKENLLSDKEFYDAMRNGAMPVTSQATPEQIRSLIQPYLEEGLDVLHIAFSSGLSGTYNSARIAADELREEFPERTIVVIDSVAASLGEGLLVHSAVEMKNSGADLQTVASWVESHKLNVAHVVTVDDLFHLFRGGRVSRTTATVGSLLNIKPIIHVDNEGKLINIGKVRGRKKALDELVKLMDQKIGSYAPTCDTIFISHSDCLEDAQYVAEQVKKKYPVRNVLINYIGSVIGSHTGPGTVALFFYADQR